MKANKKLIIIIPAFRLPFTQNEKISLNHLEKYLPNYDKYFLIPQKLKDKPKRKGYKTISFANEHFLNVSSYSKLLLSRNFYQSFSNYQYLLIYQLDALIFSSNINKWLNFNYDYIGPALLNSKIGFLSGKKGKLNYGCNGGLSLRKIESFIKVIDKAEKQAIRNTSDLAKSRNWFIRAIITGNSRHKWLKASPVCYPYNEDGFWSFEAPKYDSNFKVAPFKQALKFGFERFPRRCFKINNNQLPFGCHAWQKYDKDFWLPYIKKSGC